MAMWWKAGAVAPRMIISTLLVIGFIGPALPVVLQLVLFYGGPATFVLLWLGIGETPAARAILSARRMSAPESAAMSPALDIASSAPTGLYPGQITVTGRCQQRPVEVFGHHTIVVSRTLPVAVARGAVSSQEAAALLVHAEGVLRAGLCRHDPALWFWTTPTRVILAMFGQRRLKSPVLIFAWRMRWVVGAVAVYQSATTGPPTAGLVIGVILSLMIGLTYMTPWCARRWDRHLTKIGDQAVRDADLGPSLAGYLERSMSLTVGTLERIKTLDHA